MNTKELKHWALVLAFAIPFTGIAILGGGAQ